jgi:hypothetical protein
VEFIACGCEASGPKAEATVEIAGFRRCFGPKSVDFLIVVWIAEVDFLGRYSYYGPCLPFQ